MLILTIDTTTEYSSIALATRDCSISEYNWQCKQNHSVELMPGIAQLLKQSGYQIGDIQCIGVGVGPGNYNGLRVGLSVAKGIAYSLNIPVKGISSFETIAQEYAIPGVQIAPVIRTSRGLIAVAFYKLENDALVATAPPIVELPEIVARRIKCKTLFCGDIDDSLKEILRSSRHKTVFAGSNCGFRRAGVMAQMALRQLESGTSDNVASLEPVYLKPPHITRARDKKTISTGNLSEKAVIWDMDGVIVDSALFHLRAWQDTFEPLGFCFSGEYFWKTFGLNNFAIIKGFQPNLELDRIKQLGHDKEARFRALISRGIPPLPGAVELIIGLKKKKVPMAIASSAPLENIKCILNSLGIRQYFRALTGEENIVRGKPDPEVFLTAAGMLKIKPENCVVIEDSVPGVQAAKKAGMACLAVCAQSTQGKLTEADCIVNSLTQVNPDSLLGLIK